MSAKADPIGIVLSVSDIVSARQVPVPDTERALIL
jgi:hypothetical protein